MSRQRIILIGYRATGKTSVGKILAERLAWTFRDSDAMISASAGKSIAEIFRDDGEAEFRRLETKALEKAVAQSQIVLSCGGGAILAPRNRELLSQAGHVVWLQAEVATIQRRLSEDNQTQEQRPALAGHSAVNEVAEILEVRRPLYRQTCDHEVTTEAKTIEAIAEEILAAVQGLPHAEPQRRRDDDK